MTDYNDGKFHLWHGGECPVHPQAVVDVRFHSVESQADGLHPAKDWEWRHIGYGMDIVAFRVVKPYLAPVYLPETISPDHPAVAVFRDVYMTTPGGVRECVTAGMNAALKVLREGGE